MKNRLQVLSHFRGNWLCWSVIMLLMPFQGLVAGKLADQQVSGKVTAENGEVLPGVNVTLKGSSVGTTTDAKGDYNLSVPSESSVLVFSFIGYARQEVIVGYQNPD
jgi:hypothetical protein